MNVYEKVTARILELLEAGTIPWRKPWKSSEGPKNLFSKKPYRGINQFLLNCSPYASPYWLTFKQARQKGGLVRKGEKSTVPVTVIMPETVSPSDGLLISTFAASNSAPGCWAGCARPSSGSASRSCSGFSGSGWS